MTTTSVKKACAAAAILLASGLMAGCASSTDGFVEEGSDTGAPDTNLIKGLMQSMGAVDPHEKPIEFRPRAPLVVPPKRDLPAPVDAKAETPSNFPRNPEDVAEEQRQAALGNDKGAGGRVMTPDELSRYAIPGAGRASGMPAGDRTGRTLSVDEMKGQGMANAEAIKRVEKPQGRQSLIQPPDDYMKPSPNAPIAPPEEKSSWKPSWWPM